MLLSLPDAPRQPGCPGPGLPLHPSGPPRIPTPCSATASCIVLRRLQSMPCDTPLLPACCQGLEGLCPTTHSTPAHGTPPRAWLPKLLTFTSTQLAYAAAAAAAVMSSCCVCLCLDGQGHTHDLGLQDTKGCRGRHTGRFQLTCPQPPHQQAARWQEPCPGTDWPQG